MFTVIAAMAELEFSLTSERVSAGMKTAVAPGRRLGRPPFALGLMKEISMLAASTDLDIRDIHREVGKRASRGRVSKVTRQARFAYR